MHRQGSVEILKREHYNQLYTCEKLDEIDNVSETYKSLKLINIF